MTTCSVAAVTRAMAADHVPDGIRVNVVTPDTADTPWLGVYSTRPKIVTRK